MVAVQPAAKEPRRRLVPATRIPEAVEAIGRDFDSSDGGDERWRRVRGGSARSLGIEATRELEEIVAFGARQRQGLRDAAERLGGGLHRTPLFDPSAPGHADAGERRELLAPETRGSSPAGRRCRPHTLAVRAHELAEEAPLIFFEHGSHCNRIRFNLVTV